MALFELENLQKTYYSGGVETPVLHGLDFTIEKGEFVSVMGPSGSGKSTLLHILGFLDGHTGGEFRFDNKRYADYTEDEIARVRNREMGFVFQAFNLLPRQSVRDNIALPLSYSDVPEKKWKKRVEEVVELVGLSHRLEYPTYQLSGGEKQRTAIARALINEPNVIFADEPTGNLDTASGSAVMQTLDELHEKMGHTIVLITHETHTAEYAERMIKIIDGNIESDAVVKNRRKPGEAFMK